MIAPDDPEKLAAMKKDLGLEFPVLVDEGLVATKAYGLQNEKSPKLPHPAAIVVDAAGVVRFVRVDVDYRVRPEPAEILEALAGLGGDS